MAKKSKRRHLQFETDQSSCMWGIINIFDFRRAGSPQKMITDRRRGIRNVSGSGFSGSKLKMLTDSEKGQAIDDRKGVTGRTCVKPSVKKLIEEEMFGEVEEKTSQSEPESSVVKKARTRTVRTRSKSDDINAIVDELYTQIQQKNAHQIEHHLQSTSSGENLLDCHEKLSEATMMFITQKFISKRNVEGDEKNQHSEEFLNALETIVSNKKLLLELLEDPNSVLIQHIQTLQETMAEKDGKSKLNRGFTNGKQYSFFRRKVKSPSMENADSPNRIVILKPVANQKDLDLSGDKNVSHFSFAEIKRKLKHAMGRERPAISTDDRSCENPSLDSGDKWVGEKNVGKLSPSRKFLHTEKFPSSLKNRNKAEKIKENQTHKFSNIYIEAKKHLSEMLRHGNDAESLSSGHVPKTLGKILSFPEYNFSPIFSPRGEPDQGFVSTQIRFSSKSSPLMQDPETICFHSDGINEDKVETRSLNPDNEDKFMNDHNVEEAHSSHQENMNNEDEADIIRTIEIEEESNVLGSEQSKTFITKDEQSGYISEECDALVYSDCATTLEGFFLKESFEESQAESSQLVTPSSPPTTSEVDHVVTEVGKIGRPSPISVLEPLFADDDISPTPTVSPPVELPIMPRRLQFEKNDSSGISDYYRSKTCADDLELIFEYCENVLKASGILWGDLGVKLLSSNQLLDQSLFVEGVLCPNHLCHDQKLLFDCMNEVLSDICEYHFGCSPFVWFVNPTIRSISNTEHTIHEVCEGVKWHLTPHLSPPTLEQIVRKDMVKNGKWMDLRFDSEIVGKEMSEVVFDELMEDAILSCFEENEVL